MCVLAAYVSVYTCGQPSVRHNSQANWCASSKRGAAIGCQWAVIVPHVALQTGLANETQITNESFVRLFCTLTLNTCGCGFWPTFFKFVFFIALRQLIIQSNAAVLFSELYRDSVTADLRKSIPLNTWYVFEAAAGAKVTSIICTSVAGLLTEHLSGTQTSSIPHAESCFNRIKTWQCFICSLACWKLIIYSHMLYLYKMHQKPICNKTLTQHDNVKGVHAHYCKTRLCNIKIMQVMIIHQICYQTAFVRAEILHKRYSNNKTTFHYILNYLLLVKVNAW